MKNMITFLKWLKSLSSQQENLLTMKMRAKYPEIYWNCHPGGIYVSVWIKADFFKMDIIDFMHKYLLELEEFGISDQRKKIIESIIFPMYRELTGHNYDANIFVSYGIKNPVS